MLSIDIFIATVAPIIVNPIREQSPQTGKRTTNENGRQYHHALIHSATALRESLHCCHFDSRCVHVKP